MHPLWPSIYEESGSWLETCVWFLRPHHKQFHRHWPGKPHQEAVLPTSDLVHRRELQSWGEMQSSWSNSLNVYVRSLAPSFLDLSISLGQRPPCGGLPGRHFPPSRAQYTVVFHSQSLPLPHPTIAESMLEPFVWGSLSSKTIPKTSLIHRTLNPCAVP